MTEQVGSSTNNSNNTEGPVRKPWTFGNEEKLFGLSSSSLFTPQRLNIFDTVKFYTCIIQASRHLERGERLENISWRLTGKALVVGRGHANSIPRQKRSKLNQKSKSIKRAGVRSIYYIVRPFVNDIRPSSPVVHGETKSEPDPHAHPTVQPSSQTGGGDETMQYSVGGSYYHHQAKQDAMKGSTRLNKDTSVSLPSTNTQLGMRYKTQHQPLFPPAIKRIKQDDSLFNRATGTFNDPDSFQLSSDSDNLDSLSDNDYGSGKEGIGEGNR